MKGISVETGLVLAEKILGLSRLTEVQKAVFCGVWMKQSYQEIVDAAAEHGHYYSVGHLKNTGSELWQALTDALGERVTKTNLPEALSRHHQPDRTIQQDWGEAVASANFHGRRQELMLLKQWLPNCRVISIVGMGGMGKTSLAVRLVQDTLAVTPLPLFWRSLLNAPPIEDLLKEMIQFLSEQQEVEYPASIEGKIARVLHYLRQKRHLIGLDNLESVFQSGSAAGSYRPDYEGYGLLIQRIGEAEHPSCLILTSREKPREVAWLEGVNSPVRGFTLKGLTVSEGNQIFQTKGCFGINAPQLRQVVEHFAGNPLALNMLAASVQELFEGDLAELLTHLQQGSLRFNDINDVLTRQFERLSEPEQTVLYWLAVNREPVPAADLIADIVALPVKQELLEGLKSLSRRCLVERSEKQWSLQPVVMEYLTHRLVKQVCQEIVTQAPDLLTSHALLKAQGKDYIRQSQGALILQPLLDCLLTHLGGHKNVEYRLKELLEQQRIAAPLQPGYLGGNVLNLLRQMGADLSRVDCSYLSVWQAYLQGTLLQGTNFSHADLSKSTFTTTLNATLAVAFSPDGRLFATGNADGNVRIWQVANGQEVMTLTGHSCWVASLDFSPDSQTIASASFDQTLKIWCLQTGKCLQTFQGYNNQLWAVVRFSPDGRHVVSSGDAQNAVKLWDVDTGLCVQTLLGHKDMVFTVEFSPDGRLLASGSNDETIRVWEVQTGELLKVLTGHEGWVRAIAFCPDGILVSGSNDRTIKQWDIETGTCLSTLTGHQHLIIAMSLSADGRTLATGSQDCTVRIWDLVNKQCLKVLQGHPNGIWSVAFHPDGDRLISGSNDSMVKLWNVRTGQSLTTIQGFSRGIRTVSFSPDGQQVVSAGDDKHIRIWDAQSGELLRILPGHKSWVWSVAFSSDGRQFASGGNDTHIRLWDSETGQCRRELLGHTNLVMAVGFSADDQLLVSGCTDQTVKLWEVASGDCLRTLSCGGGRVWAATFVNATQVISGHDDNSARLWDWNTATCLHRFTGHDGLVFAVAISPDQKLLATGSLDQTIKLWDLHSRECLQTLPCQSQVWSIAFSADGRWLVSGSSDKQVRRWEVVTGRCNVFPSSHAGEVWAVTCRADAPIAASGGQQGHLNLWNLETGEPIKTLRDQGPYEGMNLTSATGLTQAQQSTLLSLGAIAI